MYTFRLKKQWFEKIKSGQKTHEYREAKDYWIKRLTNLDIGDFILFTLGTPKSTNLEKQILAIVQGVSIRNGLETDLKIDKPVFDIEFEIVVIDKEKYNAKFKNCM